MTVGSLFTIFGGLFFYTYIQQIIAAGASTAPGSSISVANALSIYNYTASMPVFVTLSIFGVAFLVMGAVFVAGRHISEHLAAQAMNASSNEPEGFTPRPSRACTKCGSLIYQNTAYCPNCGSPLGKAQSVPVPAA